MREKGQLRIEGCKSVKLALSASFPLCSLYRKNHRHLTDPTITSCANNDDRMWARAISCEGNLVCLEAGKFEAPHSRAQTYTHTHTHMYMHMCCMYMHVHVYLTENVRPHTYVPHMHSDGFKSKMALEFHLLLNIYTNKCAHQPLANKQCQHLFYPNAIKRLSSSFIGEYCVPRNGMVCWSYQEAPTW